MQVELAVAWFKCHVVEVPPGISKSTHLPSDDITKRMNEVLFRPLGFPEWDPESRFEDQHKFWKRVGFRFCWAEASDEQRKRTWAQAQELYANARHEVEFGERFAELWKASEIDAEDRKRWQQAREEQEEEEERELRHWERQQKRRNNKKKTGGSEEKTEEKKKQKRSGRLSELEKEAKEAAERFLSPSGPNETLEDKAKRYEEWKRWASFRIVQASTAPGGEFEAFYEFSPMKPGPWLASRKDFQELQSAWEKYKEMPFAELIARAQGPKRRIW